ncbi:MAG TPA: hypothetical protein VFO66_13055 [Gemmatimonadaceae bacterium]|nr:hypothetical protein [Gemmatimonadaceae bacterium]
MSIRHRLTALLVGLVLMQPVQAHDDHCASHPSDAAQQAQGHHESRVPDTGDCSHATMEACAAMTSCVSTAAEPPQPMSWAPRHVATIESPGALAPTFRTSAPETPPPRA